MPITRTAMIDDDGSGTTGTILNNAWKQELYNQIDAFVAASGLSVDTTYVTTWNGTGGVPTLGNGTLQGIYWTLGRICVGSIRLVLGSTTTIGGGAWVFSLPLPPSPGAQGQRILGVADILDVSVGGYVGVAEMFGGDPNYLLVIGQNMPNGVPVGSPFVWAPGDSLMVQFRYERA